MSLKSELIHDLVVSVEVEYGSVENAPDNDPRLLKVQKLLKPTKQEYSNYQITDKQKKEIKRLWKLNWTDSDIADELYISQESVRNIRAKYGKANKRVFILKRGYEVERFTSVAQIALLLGYSSPRSWREVQPRLVQQGWHMTERITHEY